MRYPQPMLAATLLRRYKRFLADVELSSGRRLTVHCPNSGSMKTCREPGRPVVVSDSGNPKRKLRHTWEMIRMGRTWVGVHSALSNRLVADTISQNRIEELRGYDEVRREVSTGSRDRSRLDLLLTGEGRPPCWVEVKHSTMRSGTHAAFPDAVTTRGQKHLRELERALRRGQRGVIFFAVGRNDCRRFRPADEIDPDYGQLLRRVAAAGVEILAYRFRFSPERVWLRGRLPVDL